MYPVRVEVDQGRRPSLLNDTGSAVEDPVRKSANLSGGSAISNTLNFQNLKKFSGSMIKQSIRRRIVAIAVGLIILMVATSVLSMVMVGRVGHLLDELTARYIPANAHLTRINIL